MAKRKDFNIRIHVSKNEDVFAEIRKKVTDFHYKSVERKLNSLDLTVEQRKKLIDYIVADLRSREVDGIIY